MLSQLNRKHLHNINGKEVDSYMVSGSVFTDCHTINFKSTCFKKIKYLKEW